jgi:oligopeptide transport system substrate-binding protein
VRRALLSTAAALLVSGCTTSSDLALREGDPAAQRGGTVRIATTAPGSVDPGNVYEPVGELVVRTLCTPLLATDPKTSQLVPSIASSYVVSDDGSVVTLRLREDVVFSDGSELTAEDVAFTLSRIGSADYASTSAERLAVIDGYPELHGDEPTDDDLERRRFRGVSARDDSVQVQLREPLSDFVRVLASPLLSPVSQEAVERDPKAFARQPVCVGPYALEQPFAPGDDALRLVRSEGYTPVDGSLTGGGRAYADTVEFHFYDDVTAAAAAVAAGRADAAPARSQDQDGVEAGDGPMVELLGLPTSLPAFGDPRVRRGLALALDREELVQRVFPRTREAADGFLPATSEADDDCHRLPRDGDVEQARRLLAEAGADLSTAQVPLYYNDELRNREVALEVTRQLRVGLGLRVVPTPLTYQEFLDKGTGGQGFDGLFRFSWSVPYADVDGYLHPLYSTDRIGRDNLSRFSDPEVDRTLDRIAREAEDDDDRELAYARVTELLCEQMPMIPLTTSRSRWLVGAGVGTASGQYVDDSTGRLQVRELYLR